MAHPSPSPRTVDSGWGRPSPAPVSPVTGRGRVLRLLSYNIQTGIAIHRYRHYVTHSWKHVLPYRKRLENMDQIAEIARGYDMVGLQEADAGSLRSEFINQVEYLAERAGFPFWYHQTNRRLGKIAQHSLGLLSRVEPLEITEHRLPGTLPGRGALIARFGERKLPLVLIVLHLALGRRARRLQIEYVADLVRESPHVVIMGDMNFRSESREMALFLRGTGLSEPAHGLHTFPSWAPHKNIDHIIVSPSLRVESAEVIHCPFSDHLPVATRVSVPHELRLPAARPASALARR